MNTTTFKEYALRAVAILGLLAILLLGAWGIIQLAFFISSFVSNTGGQVSTQSQTSQHELITANAPTIVTSGTPVTVTWNHSGGTSRYSYALSYSCVTGLTFKAPVPTGSAKSVNCDTPFNYTQATNSLTITPEYSGSQDAKVTLTIIATDLSTGAVSAQTSVSMTVQPSKTTATKPATTTTKPRSSATSSKAKATYVASTRSYSSLYGYADLQVSITSAYSQGGRATLQFVIQNVGTNVTPSGWTFAAQLPTDGGYTYTSAPQQALYPGDKIVYSMGYDDYPSYGYASQPYSYGYNPYGCGGNLAYGYGCAQSASSYYGGYGYAQQKTVSVTADPYNQVAEYNKGNNTASATYTAY